jgi:hypothetical protein
MPPTEFARTNDAVDLFSNKIADNVRQSKGIVTARAISPSATGMLTKSSPKGFQKDISSSAYCNTSKPDDW